MKNIKKYNIILADPPWSYDDKLSGEPAHGGITYPTLEMEDLKALPIKEIADKNCVLFLWVTMPFLAKGIELMEAWGFKYRTCAFTWVKTNRKNGEVYHGLGHYTASNAELCLLGRRGRLDRVTKNIKQIVMSPVTKHSAKPPEVRDKIVSLFGELPRIELFARERVDGWDAVGFDLDGKDIREVLK